MQTIHFARWVFLDDKTRVAFTSNYDGSHQSYMDDFINKVAWGLNLSFSHGVGWPRTRWLVARGARIENKFKNYQRRHQLPTQVWYKAYPGLALVDLKRNQRIREGLELASVTDDHLMRVQQTRKLHRDFLAPARRTLDLRGLGDIGGHCQANSAQKLDSLSNGVHKFVLFVVVLIK